MSGTNDGGWIKLHRRFLRSAIWQNPNVARFWTWALLKATHDGYTTTIGYRKVTLEPGQFIFTRPLACAETLLSEKTVRLCVEMLKSGDTPEIGLTKGHNFSVITLLKWGSYQGGSGNEGRQRADKGPAKGRLINKEGKNGKKKGMKIDVIWNGETLEIPDVLMGKYRAKYPSLDIASIVIDAERWLLKHPTKAASYKSFDAFLNNWLRGEEDKRKKRDGDDAPYELAGESLAAALECAKLHGRAADE